MTNKNALKDMKAAILLACQQTQQVLEKDDSHLPSSGVDLKLHGRTEGHVQQEVKGGTVGNM